MNSDYNEDKYYPWHYSVKFKGNKKQYSFGSEKDDYKQHDLVVVESLKGLEIAEIVSIPRKSSELTNGLLTPTKPIKRLATKDDFDNQSRNDDLAKIALDTCTRFVEQLNLNMNLISAEYTLDRSKVQIVYVADDRVDFRELLKELASTLKCRIELRQIGSRDKAKIIGGLGTCGMETCCSRFLNDFNVVSINMAKNQMLALNIQKLSGQCGKLMCCLKYEDENYKTVRKGLPKINSQVEYNNKKYRLSNINIVTNMGKLDNSEGSINVSLDKLRSTKNIVMEEDNEDPKDI